MSRTSPRIPPSTDPGHGSGSACGRQSPYHAQDWARLAIAYAETGELIHPRLERRERSLRELPKLPLAYADAAPLLAEPARYPVDEGYQEPDLTPPPRPAGGPGARK